MQFLEYAQIRDVLIYFIHLCWGIFRISMFLNWIIWCFSWCLCSSSKTQAHKQPWYESMSTATFRRTKGGKMCTLVCQILSWIFTDVFLCIQLFQGMGVFHFSCSDMVVPDSFWHVSCPMLTLRWREGCRTDWFILGHCEAPGIHVDGFGPDIMYLPRLQSTYCTCVSVSVVIH